MEPKDYKKTPQLLYTKITYKRKNYNKNIKNRHKSKRKVKLWLFIITVIAFSFMWWKYVETQAHVYPKYPETDIQTLIYSGEDLQTEDYRLLFKQTGMGRAGIDYLFAGGMKQKLLMLQDNYFADVDVECQSNTLITREERLKEEDASFASARVLIPYVEEGDILISFNCHVFGWRNGHVALVVDAGKRLTLEASELGTDTSVVSMNHWERYPSFVILRLKNASKEERAAIAGYAEENLKDVPYSLQAGIIERIRQRLKKEGNVSAVEGTHCAHLVWYAYKQFGYDTDSDGGLIVTPRDLYESDLFEVVQIYGMEY